MIPLEKLIEYKGNRYELTKAMIELARNGKDLLKPEVRYKKDKYVAVVISNVLDGKIKFDYTDGGEMQIDEYAPYKTSEESYDEAVYIAKEEEEKNNIDDAPKDEDYDEDYDEDEDEDD